VFAEGGKKRSIASCGAPIGFGCGARSSKTTRTGSLFAYGQSSISDDLEPRALSEIETNPPKARSDMVRLTRKRSGADHKDKRAWVPHATELVLAVYDPASSNDGLAIEMMFRWELNPDKSRPKCPSAETLSRFVAKLRADKRLPPRTRL
jgi:hypothetical protein